MPWRQHIRHWGQFNKYGLTKKDVYGASTRTIKNVVLAGIHTLPQEAVCSRQRGYTHEKVYYGL